MPAVAVVGLGLMGASFALALKDSRPDVVLVGSDPDAVTVRKAVDRGIVESASINLDVVDIADVIVLAVPILAMRDVLANIAKRAKGTGVTDMSSPNVTAIGWPKES